MFRTNTQPLYALIDHEGNLLTYPRVHDLNIQGFVDFLDTGKNEFRKRVQ